MNIKNWILSWVFKEWDNEVLKIRKTKDKNGENVSHLEITEVVLVHCYIANNDYQQNSRVLYTFVRNNPCGCLLETPPTNFIPLKTFNLEFSYIKVWFTGQNSQSLEREDRTNLTLALNDIAIIKMCYSIESKN